MATHNFLTDIAILILVSFESNVIVNKLVEKNLKIHFLLSLK